MIFVTVGTHERPFNRLVEHMDKWAAEHDEEVVMQIGYSTYEPKRASWQKLFPYQEMVKKVDEARIVITHGGPSSFIMPLQIGKIPVVVPRKAEYNEHVNNHQVDFCNQVAKRQGNIIVAEEINKLDDILVRYENTISVLRNELISNNEQFCDEFEKIVERLER